MDNTRLIELLNKFIGYCVELKSNEKRIEQEFFFRIIIGMSDKELEYFGIDFEGVEV